MKKSNFAVAVLIIIAIGVFLISNYVTHWTNEAIEIKEDIQQQLIQSHRNEMRQVLRSAREGLLYDVDRNELDVTDEDAINQLVYKHVAPLKNSSFGEVILLRINPDKRILYDSSNETIKEGINCRDIEDEIIAQEKAEKIINGELKDNHFFKDGTLDIVELNIIKKKYPDVYNKLNEHIAYMNLPKVAKILRAVEQGNPTTSEDNYRWELKNGGVELLEWVVIPPGSLGFRDKPKSYFGIRKENQKWVLMLRAKEQAVLKQYKNIEKRYLTKIAVAKVMYIGFIFILISGILIISYYAAIIKV